MADPTGEADRSALRLDFDRRLMLQFRGSTITSDAGLLACRELDNALHLTDAAADKLADARLEAVAQAVTPLQPSHETMTRSKGNYDQMAKKL